jgi:hypothetical protein
MKLLAVALFLTMLVSIGMAAGATYVTPGNPSVLTGNATVGEGTGATPEVKYSWVLPDDSPATGTQLEIVPSGERNDIYACIVVSDADSRDSIQDVFMDLYHPDGSFKYQVPNQDRSDDHGRCGDDRGLQDQGAQCRSDHVL